MIYALNLLVSSFPEGTNEKEATDNLLVHERVA